MRVAIDKIKFKILISKTNIQNIYETQSQRIKRINKCREVI